MMASNSGVFLPTMCRFGPSTRAQIQLLSERTVCKHIHADAKPQKRPWKPRLGSGEERKLRTSVPSSLERSDWRPRQQPRVLKKESDGEKTERASGLHKQLRDLHRNEHQADRGFKNFASRVDSAYERDSSSAITGKTSGAVRGELRPQRSEGYERPRETTFQTPSLDNKTGNSWHLDTETPAVKGAIGIRKGARKEKEISMSEYLGLVELPEKDLSGLTYDPQKYEFKMTKKAVVSEKGKIEFPERANPDLPEDKKLVDGTIAHKLYAQYIDETFRYIGADYKRLGRLLPTVPGGQKKHTSSSLDPKKTQVYIENARVDGALSLIWAQLDNKRSHLREVKRLLRGKCMTPKHHPFCAAMACLSDMFRPLTKSRGLFDPAEFWERNPHNKDIAVVLSAREEYIWWKWTGGWNGKLIAQHYGKWMPARELKNRMAEDKSLERKIRESRVTIGRESRE